MNEDEARIDWLESRRGLLNYADGGPHVCIDDGRTHNYHVYGDTYREVLDNAMREYVPFTPPAQSLEDRMLARLVTCRSIPEVEGVLSEYRGQAARIKLPV